MPTPVPEMDLILRFAMIVLTASLAGHAARAQSILPGNYVTEGRWGTLAIEPDGRFRLDTIGANAHTCEVEAVIRGSKALTSEGCSIKFERSLDRVSVYPEPTTQEACRSHCGMRAAFQGDFFREIPACREDPVKQERERFAKLYRGRRYREAAEVLSTLLNRCGRFLYWLPDEAQVRNDLAVTYHHLSDDAACIGVLSPLRRTFVEDSRITGRVFTPADQPDGPEMVRITRFNWQTCGGEVPQEGNVGR